MTGVSREDTIAGLMAFNHAAGRHAGGRPVQGCEGCAMTDQPRADAIAALLDVVDDMLEAYDGMSALRVARAHLIAVEAEQRWQDAIHHRQPCTCGTPELHRLRMAAESSRRPTHDRAMTADQPRADAIAALDERRECAVCHHWPMRRNWANHLLAYPLHWPAALAPADPTADLTAEAFHDAWVTRGMRCEGTHAIGEALCQNVTAVIAALAAEPGDD